MSPSSEGEFAATLGSVSTAEKLHHNSCECKALVGVGSRGCPLQLHGGEHHLLLAKASRSKRCGQVHATTNIQMVQFHTWDVLE